MSYEIDVKDIEYLRHPTGALMATVFQPRGSGPFPLIVDIHGGAWVRGDRTNDKKINEALAKSGVVVAAIDFRVPPVASYPASVQDINYAIRYFKAKAADFTSRADLVGSMGASSGSHQAVLSAMRPRDKRYAALPLPAGSPNVDATVRCVVACWPVIDPLGRYHYAKKLKASGQPYPEVIDRVLPCHDQYWITEEAMAEASPPRILEQGEKTELPPVFYVQGTKDQAHPRPDLDRFVAAYRKAGGEVQLELLEGVGEGFIGKDSPEAKQAIDGIIAFVHKHIG
jgi:acetyl esterase/lipase